MNGTGTPIRNGLSGRRSSQSRVGWRRGSPARTAYSIHASSTEPRSAPACPATGRAAASPPAAARRWWASTRRFRRTTTGCGSSRRCPSRAPTARRPAATAAADPPLDPPVMRAGSHGFRVAPHAETRLVPPAASSCWFSLPIITRPARRTRAIVGASSVATRPAYAAQHPLVSWSATSNRSLTATGTPARGRSSSGPARSTASAAASASSAQTCENALVTGCQRSASSSARAASSRAETSPAASAAAIPAAVP